MEKEKIVIEVPTKVLHVEHAQCPRGHSLMDSAVPINGYPSIKVVIQYGAMGGIDFTASMMDLIFRDTR